MQGVRLTEAQYMDAVSELIQAQDLAPRGSDGHDVRVRIQHVLDILEQEHYPTVPEPDDGIPC